MELENRRPPAAQRTAGVENASVSTLFSYFREGWKYASGLISREHFLSLADQAVVSSAGFLTTVLIARWSGPSQLGIYALGLSILLSLLGFQEFSFCSPI